MAEPTQAVNGNEIARLPLLRNAPLQARREAGAQRALYAVACKR